MESVKKWSANWHMEEFYQSPHGTHVAVEDFDRVSAENLALQQRLTVLDQRVDDLETELKVTKQALNSLKGERDEQLTSLEQRRYAEQQAREAAEKNADRYRWLLGNADIMHWENMLRCADLEGVESINQFIDAAINHAAEAVSPANVCSGCGASGWTVNCSKCVPY